MVILAKTKHTRKMENTKNYDLSMVSEEQMIKIHEEAYYRALKRIKNENDKNELIKEKSKAAISKRTQMAFLLNAMFVPMKINRRFIINDKIYEGIITLFISSILWILGLLMWIFGIFMVVQNVLNMFSEVSKFIWVAETLVGLAIWLLGSIFIMSSSKFKKEEDSNRIYAFSGSILALLSLVISIIALFISWKP